MKLRSSAYKQYHSFRMNNNRVGQPDKKHVKQPLEKANHVDIRYIMACVDANLAKIAEKKTKASLGGRMPGKIYENEI